MYIQYTINRRRPYRAAVRIVLWRDQRRVRIVSQSIGSSAFADELSVSEPRYRAPFFMIC